MNWTLDEDGNYNFEGDVKSLGYTDEEIEAIQSRISLRLSFEDWKSFVIFDEGYIIDPGDDQYLRLPTGRVVLIPYDIYADDILIHVD
ncbi:hypothetical protein [Paenibacillus wynnii]|uniref:Uncharacterized protein n=1 Tax=Paenibacillus wynnii TaxID=268407 RepID=A0A098MFI7_9BACL|nr:hypothetical protein [Paenibacillus wynnii]KGE20793.1 hypothetical protein PWYN_01025 [Paenibacillus wynnii]